jgi:hypothetical protein
MHSRRALDSVRRDATFSIKEVEIWLAADTDTLAAGDMSMGSVEEALEYQATWPSSTLMSKVCLGVSLRGQNSTMIIDWPMV